MFKWPEGILVGNLIAAAICGVPAYIHTHLKFNRHQEEIKDLLDPNTPGGIADLVVDKKEK